MNQDQAFLELAAGFRRDFGEIEDAMLRHQPAAADPEFRIAFTGSYAFDEFHSGPHTARVLPATTGAAQPLAQKSPRQNQSALVFLQRSDERCGLACCPHADTD